MDRGRGRVVLIGGIMLSVFVIAFQMIGLATALPTLMDSFGAGHLYPWAFTTMVSGMMLATVLSGPLSDRRGPAIPMLVGFTLFIAGLVLGWLAPWVSMVLVARLVQGLGAGALNLALSVVIAHGFSPRERPKVMALVSFCWLLPAFVGPPFAAWLTHYSWRLVFASMIPLVLLAFITTLPGLREVQRTFVAGEEEVVAVPPAPILLVTLGPSLILVAGQGLGWWSAVSGVAGVAALAWGLPRILTPSARGFGPGVPSVVLARALQAGAFFASEAILLVTLQNLRGYSPYQVGWGLTVGSVGWTVASWLQSQSWFRLSRDGFITLGSVLTMLGIAALALFAWTAALPLAFGLSAWTLAGAGMGFTMPSSAVAVMSLSSRFEQGRNQSSMQLAESVGNAVVTAVVGGLYTALLVSEPRKLGYTVALCAAMAVVALAVLVSRRIGRIHNDLLGAD